MTTNGVVSDQACEMVSRAAVLGQMSLSIFLVRHGQSEWNAIGRMQGHTRHVGLTELGIQQASAVARRLAAEDVDVLITSDLIRAVQTARAVAKATGLPVVADRRLRERCYGVLDGRWASDPAFAAVDSGDTTSRVGGGESFEDVYQRVGELLSMRIAIAHSSQHRGIVLVTHGEAIRAAIAWLSGGDSRAAPTTVPSNGSVTRIRITSTTPTSFRSRPLPIGTSGDHV